MNRQRSGSIWKMPGANSHGRIRGRRRKREEGKMRRNPNRRLRGVRKDRKIMTDLPKAVVQALIAKLDSELASGSGTRALCRAKGHVSEHPGRYDYLYEVTADVKACRRCVQGIIAGLQIQLTSNRIHADKRDRYILRRMRRSA
jgi:hypothetical protein